MGWSELTGSPGGSYSRGLDRTRIEAWMDNLTDSSGLEDNASSPEADIWDTEPVGLSDGLSVPDRENYGKTIRRRRKLGEAQRDLDRFYVQEEDTWDVGSERILRRHSWSGH